MEDLSLIPGLGRSTGEEKGHPCQYSGLENSMDCIVHRVAKSQIKLSNFHFHNGKETFFCQRATASTLFPLLKDLAPSVTTPPLTSYSLILICMHMSILIYLSLLKITYNTHIYIHIFPHPYPAIDPILFSTA